MTTLTNTSTITFESPVIPWEVVSVTWTTVFLALTTLAVLLYYHYYQQLTEDHWSQYGVVSPKISRFYFFGDDFRTMFSNLLDKYGDTVGFKVGSRLSLTTTNLNLLRHILIKDFNNFVDRADQMVSKSPFTKSLFFARGTDWRRHRQVMSPMFSTGKLKNFMTSVDQSGQSLAKYFEGFAKEGTTAPMKDACARYTCEVIAKTAFGLQASFIGQTDAEFFQYGTQMFTNSRVGYKRILFQILGRFPTLIKICVKIFRTNEFFDPVNVKANEYFSAALRETVTERRRRQECGISTPQGDFLDLILKASEVIVEENLDAVPEDIHDSQRNGSGSRQTPKGMTEEEMLGHSMLVVFAGIEPTATTLQMCLYELARNQEIQERIYHEIQSEVRGESPTSEELTKLVYTEQTINETLRMYPPLPSVDRVAKETKTYHDITIPQGTSVMIPFWHILKDPKIFPDPKKFDPDRFSPEEREKRDAMAFVPFSHGPRLCLGQRLAYMELKVALVHILRKLKVVVNDKTEPKKGCDVRFTPRGLITPVKPIMLAFEFRT